MGTAWAKSQRGETAWSLNLIPKGSGNLWKILSWGMASFLFFWPRHAACGILVPQPGIEPMPPIMEVQSLNHWIARETPTLHFRMITLAGSSVRNTAREERLHKTVRWETIRAAKELKEHCHLFIYFWLLLGLCCCMRAFSSFSEQGLLSTYVGFSLRWLLLL